MSIIERAAELLRAAREEKRGPAPAVEKAKSHRRNVIEAASADLVNATQPRMHEAPARQGEAASRQFAVDRNRLRAQSLITPDGERTPLAESFRRIKRQILTNVEKPKPGDPATNVVLVTSALPGEGKTFCAINLAISMALERNRTVLLVDADVAKPSVPRMLGLKAPHGLMDVLLDRDVAPADVLWKTDIGALTVLPAGTPHQHATELLASDAMRGLMRDLSTRYADRIVLLDSPPILAASEAAALASQAGQIVVVVEASKTSEEALKRALGRIDAGRVTGLILNKVDAVPLSYSYDGYGY